MTFQKSIARLGLAALLGATALSPASAQMLTSRVVAFGDSLSDNGNLFAVSGNPPAPYNHRFTNALTWVEYLAGPLATSGANTLAAHLPLASGNLDFAFGGSRTDSAQPPGSGPGIQTQINGFAAFGGSFGANDVATLWGGANDLFQGIAAAVHTPSTAQATMTTVATTAGNNIANEVQQLIGLGAKKIIVNTLPDFASLPTFAGGPAQALAGYSSATFNATLQARLAAIAAANPGVNIVTVDIATAFNAVIANPSAFGLTNTSAQCIASAACALGSLSTQNSYLFWDSVHPTQTGHQIIANVVNATLVAGNSAASARSLTDIGYVGRRAAMLGAFDQFAAIPKTGDKPDYFVSVVGDRNSRTASAGQAAFSSTEAGLRIGMVRSLNEAWRFGIALSALTGTAKAGDISFNPTHFNADAMLGWQNGLYFANFGVGASAGTFGNYKRQLVGLPWQNTATVGGFSASSTFETGAKIKSGSFELTPMVRLAYLYANSDAYSENGNAAMVAVNGRSVSALTGAVALNAATQISEGLKASATIGYEAVLAGSATSLTAQLVNNSALPTIVAASRPQSAGLTLGLGLEGKMSAATSWQVSYRGAMGSHASSHQFNIGVHSSF